VQYNGWHYCFIVGNIRTDHTLHVKILPKRPVHSLLPIRLKCSYALKPNTSENHKIVAKQQEWRRNAVKNHQRFECNVCLNLQTLISRLWQFTLVLANINKGIPQIAQIPQIRIQTI
jgi:hypothetical protein